MRHIRDMLRAAKTWWARPARAAAPRSVPASLEMLEGPTPTVKPVWRRPGEAMARWETVRRQVINRRREVGKRARVARRRHRGQA